MIITERFFDFRIRLAKISGRYGDAVLALYLNLSETGWFEITPKEEGCVLASTLFAPLVQDHPGAFGYPVLSAHQFAPFMGRAILDFQKIKTDSGEGLRFECDSGGFTVMPSEDSLDLQMFFTPALQLAPLSLPVSSRLVSKKIALHH